MEYSQMAKHPTSPEMSKAFLWKISDLPQEEQLRRVKKSFQHVFKGIVKHKYHKIQLLIDDNMKPITQPQRKIPFAKREKFGKILDKLKESGIIEQVEGPTDWLSNLVLTSKGDPTQIRMNIDMTMANTSIQRT